MQLEVLKAKILRATVTETHLDYEGSLAIDADLLETVGIIPHEKVLIGNITNGNRFETYIMPAARGSRTFAINGAAAHLGAVGDLLVIMAFAKMSPQEATTWQPSVMVLKDDNHTIAELRSGIPEHPHPVA